MNRRRAILIISGTIVGLVAVVFLYKYFTNNQYRSRIPGIEQIQSQSEPLEELLAEALSRAQRKPSAENMGALAMSYHANAFYEEAARCYELAIQREERAWIWAYYRGYLSVEMGESQAAISNFRKVTEINPENQHAWYYLGESNRNLGKDEEALLALQKISENLESTRASDVSTRQDNFPLGIYARFQIARIYMDSGQTDLAESTLKEILQISRDFGPAYRLLGSIYLEKGDEERSTNFVERANDLVVFSPPVDTLVDKLVLLSRSQAYLLKKIDEAQRNIHSGWALQLTDNAVRYIADNKYIIAKAIKIYLWLEKEEEATALIDQHIIDFQDDFTELYNTGLAFFVKNFYPQSIRYLNTAMKLRPENHELQELLALAYLSAGDREKSRQILDEMLQGNPGDPELMASVANVLFYNFNEKEEARSYLPGLLKQAPSNPKVQKLAAGIAELDGNFPSALQLYKSSFRNNPEDESTIRMVGTSLTNREMWAEAIDLYREALELHPNDAYFLERLGTLLTGCPDTSLRNPGEAKLYLERAFIHKESSLTNQVYSGRALAFTYANLGDKANAIKTINETMKLARQANFSPSYISELQDFHDAAITIPD